MGRAALEKQVDGLKLEVHRVNRFFDRETMAHPQDKPDIFPNVESSGAAVGGIDAHRSTNGGDCEHGSMFTYTADHWGGTSQPNSTCYAPLSGQRAESIHVGQGRFPKLQFPVFVGEDPQL
jgi:hypothetical protein